MIPRTAARCRTALRMAGLQRFHPLAGYRPGAGRCPVLAGDLCRQPDCKPISEHEFGINFASAGLFTTIWGVGVAVGGLTGGRLVDRLGHRRSLVTAAAASLAGVLLLAITPSVTAAVALVALFGLAFGYYETVYFAISMNLTDPRIAASMFAILMAVANVGTGVGLGASGALVDGIGFRMTFAVVALLNLLVLPLIPGVFRRSAPAEVAGVVAE